MHIMLYHWISIDCPAWPSTPGIPVFTFDSYHANIGFITSGFRCVVSLPLPKPTVLFLHHPSGTHTKYSSSPDSNGLHCSMTLNTGNPHHDLLFDSANMSTILGGVGCMVPLSGLKTSRMVLHHTSLTHTEYVSSLDSDGLPCVFFNPMCPCSAWCLLACQKWLYLEWFQVGDIIIMT